MLTRKHRRVKGTDHGDNLVRLVPRRDGLLDAAAHVSFAHQIFRTPARLVFLQLA